MEGSLNCDRCGNEVCFLFGNHCEDCCKIAKVGKCTKCTKEWNFFPERHDFDGLENRFDFLCNNCKCVQCHQQVVSDFFVCHLCESHTCVECVDDDVTRTKRFVCVQCKCRKCKRAAKIKCETKSCKFHCDKVDCKAHTRKIEGEKKEEDVLGLKRAEIEISSSFSDADIGELAFRLLTVKERLAMIQNDKQKEDAFRQKVAAGGSFGECAHYLAEWQMQMEKVNMLQKEKEVLKKRQQNEFKRLRMSKPNETENF
jgi:hypothetical protein